MASCVSRLRCLSSVRWQAARTLGRAFPCRRMCDSSSDSSSSSSGNSTTSDGNSKDLTTLGMENGVKASLETRSGQRIEIVQGDILDEDVDAIVNPTDTWLFHESKLSSDIMVAAGYLARRQNEKLIQRYNNIPVGSVGMVTGGFLSCHSIIHAVTPKWNDESEEELDYSLRMLRAALHYALLVCHDKSYYSVSMPALGAGCNGWPRDLCCRLLLHTTLSFLAEHPLSSLKFVCFADSDPVVVAAFVNEAAQLRHPNLITMEAFDKLSDSSSSGDTTSTDTNS